MNDGTYQKNRNIIGLDEDEDMLFMTPTLDNSHNTHIPHSGSTFSNTDYK
jgi:hypothetical protein